ncbi:acetyl-CoA carboxylase biotin carboxyl carrier protein subunit [Robertkochia sediminum]|uniref:acetyl-CoA carboxylase biotin carboxyl carrier protein subunit n=1 Tax=Robertkochia sediminum TaxID=2785326 RepID=UPI0019335029|nr:acetyl-CoA carboxylase biotin carboxyl carrier protein subunit [Robertkochia sediminum]MBL7472264.1 acetyl-CoA carboxylase biotin carboxyl carrier protein subunit [Robertkochia sediminum]
MAGTYKALVNELDTFEFSDTEIAKANLIHTGGQTYHLIRDHRSAQLQIESYDLQERTYLIRVGDERFRVQISRPIDLFIEQMGFAVSDGDQVDTVVAPMPGLLLDIYVREGQEVEKDEPLLVLEAMKMENVILSPRKGTIASVRMAVGASVEKGSELIAFE